MSNFNVKNFKIKDGNSKIKIGYYRLTLKLKIKIKVENFKIKV